jgi:hypothetical protein
VHDVKHAFIGRAHLYRHNQRRHQRPVRVGLRVRHCCADADADPDPDPEPDADAVCVASTDSYADSYADSYSDSYPDPDSFGHAG